MKYAYELSYPNGIKAFNVQDYYFTESQMLKACKESDDKEFNTVVSVKHHRNIPDGYHLCSCGNLAKGNRDELCKECQEIYGHKYEHQI